MLLKISQLQVSGTDPDSRCNVIIRIAVELSYKTAQQFLRLIYYHNSGIKFLFCPVCRAKYLKTRKCVPRTVEWPCIISYLLVKVL